MVNEVDVATAALAIAISALVIAAGQLIAQLFSTADGYRRCQPSIIGDWYKLVELRFRWSSFRYEVKVTTPHFEIATMSRCGYRTSFLLHDEKPLPNFPWSLFTQKSQYLVPPWTPAPLLNTKVSRLGTFCQAPQSVSSSVDELSSRVDLWKKASMTKGVGEDVPTWVILLEDIHSCQEFSQGGSSVAADHKEWPKDLAPICISRKTRSWDFMPPDIVRPVASTTLGCLITMAHRLGMNWTDFRPDEGKMRATGPRGSFSTSMIRGMGLVVEYTTARSDLHWEWLIRIPSIAADKIACGIIPIGEPFLFHEDLHLRGKDVFAGTDSDVSFFEFRISHDAKASLTASMSHRDPAHRLPAFTDTLGLCCPWLPVEGIFPTVFDNPFPFPLTTMGERNESLHVWRLLLREQEATLSDQCKQVLQFFNRWYEFSNYNKHERYSRYHDYQAEPRFAFFKKAFEDATTYLKDAVGNPHDSHYRLLVGCHVSVNVHSIEQAEKNIRSKGARTSRVDVLISLDPIFVERAYIYAENVPKFVEEMQNNSWHNQGKNISYEDVWWTMMMRLHAWTMSVRWVEGEGVKIPSIYYDDPTRVYIL